MTLTEHDARCNDLFRKLDALKASGNHLSTKYMETLRALQSATRDRVRAVAEVCKLSA